MRILLSNDDGILAPGLAALYAATADMGEVSVVAPDSPQSAAGHSITIVSPLNVRRIRVDAAVPFDGISVDGKPADCVRLAVRRLLDDRPDLVISGINAGANAGINVFYSGTVAAAAEAAMLGLPAVAFSASMAGEVDFARCGKLCRFVLEALLRDGIAPGDLVNVNLPAGPKPPRGVRVVPQSTAGIEDAYEHHQDSDGREAYRLGDIYSFLSGSEDNDVDCLADGYITVTPLHFDMTRHGRLAALGQIEWGELPT